MCVNSVNEQVDGGKHKFDDHLDGPNTCSVQCAQGTHVRFLSEPPATVAMKDPDDMEGTEMPHTSHHRPHRHVPEARVTGRPRLVVVRKGGRVELPDTAAYLLMTAALAIVAVLPALLGRYS